MADGSQIHVDHKVGAWELLEDAAAVSDGVWIPSAAFGAFFFLLTGAALAGADAIELHAANEKAKPLDTANGTVIHTFSAGEDAFWELAEGPMWLKAKRSNAGGSANAGCNVKSERRIA